MKIAGRFRAFQQKRLAEGNGAVVHNTSEKKWAKMILEVHRDAPMKAYEFVTRKSDGKLEVPETVLASIAPNRAIRALVLVSESSDDDAEDAEWIRMATEQFMAGYDEEAAIYDRI